MVGVSPLLGQRSPMSFESLLAVPAVLVEVEGVDSAAIGDGLIPELIVAAVRTQLGGAQIRTLSEPEWQQVIGNPSLVVKYELKRVSQFLTIYRMTLELRQMSVLTRDTTKLVYSTTWSAGSILGSIRNQNLPQLGERVSEMVNWFIEDYWVVRDPEDEAESGEREVRSEAVLSHSSVSIRQSVFGLLPIRNPAWT
jgi:hypothetical protein